MRCSVWTMAVVTSALVGCRSTDAILTDQEAKISYGRYAEAGVEPAKLADEGGRDAPCWQLHAATAAHLSADADEAIRRFDLAEDGFLDFDARGALTEGAQGAWSLLTSDVAMPYAGSGQDRVFTCLYKALNYGVKGNAAAIRTELNRALQHQENWRAERSAEIAAAAAKMTADTQAKAGSSASTAATAPSQALADAGFAERIRSRTGFDPAVGGQLERLVADDYTNNYLLKFNEIFRRNVGDSGPKPANRVTVFVEDGLCPRRREWRLDLPLVLIPGVNRYVQYAGMALPELVLRNAAVTAYSVTAGGSVYPMPVVQDVDRLVKTEFDVFFKGALAREITRAVTRVTAQAALGVASQAAYHQHSRDGDAAAVLLTLVQLGVAGWSAAETEADLRSWTTLPKSVYMIDVPRPADGIVTVNAGLEKIQVNVPEGNTMVVVRKASSAAPSVVKSFTLPN